MDMYDYQQFVRKTSSQDYDKIRKRLANLSDREIDVFHGVIGCVTEAGESMDAFKKHLFYGKLLDYKNLREEAGDTMWYVTLQAIGFDKILFWLMQNNYDKLIQRYPRAAFSESDAIERKDKTTEEGLEDLGRFGNEPAAQEHAGNPETETIMVCRNCKQHKRFRSSLDSSNRGHCHTCNRQTAWELDEPPTTKVQTPPNLGKAMPMVTHFTDREGGPWIPWEAKFESSHVAAIKFHDGNILDTESGMWRWQP